MALAPRDQSSGCSKNFGTQLSFEAVFSCSFPQVDITGTSYVKQADAEGLGWSRASNTQYLKKQSSKTTDKGESLILRWTRRCWSQQSSEVWSWSQDGAGDRRACILALSALRQAALKCYRLSGICLLVRSARITAPPLPRG